MLLKIVNFKNIFAIMLPIFVRPERVWPKLSSIQVIRANLVYIVSLTVALTQYLDTKLGETPNVHII